MIEIDVLGSMTFIVAYLTGGSVIGLGLFFLGRLYGGLYHAFESLIV